MVTDLGGRSPGFEAKIFCILCHHGQISGSLHIENVFFLYVLRLFKELKRQHIEYVLKTVQIHCILL
jgi:hypothetical protein